MGLQIIKQPNGLYCMYSSICDDFVITDATPQEIIGHLVQIESEKITSQVNDIVSELSAGGKPYRQFTMTFEEAVELAKEVHGKNWQPPKEAYVPIKNVPVFPKRRYVMRSREEIERNMFDSYDFEAIAIELLLDIRDAKISEAKWGIYCPQHYGSWHNRPDGEIYSYPTEEVAKAHLESMSQYLVNVENHLWEVVEFSKQKYVDPDKSPAGTEICPVRYPPHFTEAF